MHYIVLMHYICIITKQKKDMATIFYAPDEAHKSALDGSKEKRHRNKKVYVLEFLLDSGQGLQYHYQASILPPTSTDNVEGVYLNGKKIEC